MIRRFSSFLALVSLALAVAAAPGVRAAQDIQLSFGTLPSAQGFTYTPIGFHAGAVEGSVFSIAGGVLTQNTMSLGLSTTGGGVLYAIPGIITASEPKELHVTARCLQAQGSGINPAGQWGFCFGFTTGSVQYAVSITPTQVYTLGPSGSVAVAGTYDNTQFHDWLLEYTPPGAFRLYRDGILIHAGTTGAALALNRLFLGDGTGAANARAEVSAFHFLQGSAVPTLTSSWGEVKERYR